MQKEREGDSFRKKSRDMVFPLLKKWEGKILAKFWCGIREYMGKIVDNFDFEENLRKFKANVRWKGYLKKF